jgi:putative methyltransferase (TIGR04325 family)
MHHLLHSLLQTSPLIASLSAVGSTTSGRRFLSRLAETKGVYRNLEEARKVAQKKSSNGHEHPDNIKLHFELSTKLRLSDYPAMFWLERICRPGVKVFDYGGSVGNLFYLYKDRVPALSSSDWIVYDLPRTIESGSRIAASRGEARLTFTNDLRDGKGADVLLASGSFHYWEDSVAKFLRQFERRPNHVLVNRTPFRLKGSTFYGVQAMASYAVAAIIRNRDDVIKAFEEDGYELADSWTVPDRVFRLPLFPDYAVEYFGMYFRRTQPFS